MSSTLTGKVVEVDDTGSLITDIDVDQLSSTPHDTNTRIVVDEHETCGLYPPDHSEPSMTLIAVVADQGPLKISLVDDSASAMLGVKVGAAVEVHW